MNKSKKWVYLLICNIVAFIVALLVTLAVFSKQSIVDLDLLISQKIMMLWQPWLNSLMTFITHIADTKTFMVLAAVLAAVLTYKKRKKQFLLFLFSCGAGILSYSSLNAIIARPRPENYLLWVPHFSFPSGHTIMATIFFLFLIYAFKNNIAKKTQRKVFVIICVLLFILIGFSRIYLNAHWFSDVVAGFAIGIFWSTLFILIFHHIKELSKNKLFIAIMIIVFIIGAMMGAKMLFDEDDWICKDGQWIRHGNPRAPMPTEPCE